MVKVSVGNLAGVYIHKIFDFLSQAFSLLGFYMHVPGAVVSPNSVFCFVFWFFFTCSTDQVLPQAFLKLKYAITGNSTHQGLPLVTFQNLWVVICILCSIYNNFSEGFALRVCSNILELEFLSPSFLKTSSTEYTILC